MNRDDWPLLIFLTPLILVVLGLLVIVPLELWDFATTHSGECFAFVVGALLGFWVGHSRGWRLARRDEVTPEEIKERKERAQSRAEKRTWDARHEQAVERADKERRQRKREEGKAKPRQEGGKDWIV